MIADDHPGWSGTDVELGGSLNVEATAEGSPTRGIWVRGSLKGRLKTACRRCLEPLELDISESFHMLFDPKTAEGEGDLDLYGFDAGADELDLRPHLIERFLLLVPAFPECAAGCAGYCARCGADLSEEECRCAPAESDPRWGPLRALKAEGEI
ncbi:MAG: DUF177 domain-containing protein [Gemmatimonadetes bacterium]|uniref:DUF177 domain-containing protein n=1 Tax=Candidatus Kutchimonas denitrificans TaxID=3056748 RepID=A0AAE5CC50_9BACT|nr:DUF177 domain-containing protein [Gemmatimonadota bacterium]NIR75225.1 DUF177 domain-containing protein [Candidatus Kutchimonas denitrificans]NIS00163.1 DUF177 domain-containing protein [Gemmatimonadota bacterium]NIT65755.1 DUF177 domain-containing protein [Gemmatimonadota bacterium]NIU53033.1 hypothetical protein [Gemmatimonadota bacterium]